MGLLGSVPWSLNCRYYTIISLQLLNMTCYCTVHGPSMEAPSNKLQVVMHHMWWSSPKSNSKIQHQKKSFLGKIYSIMAWNWHEWVPMSVLSTVEVFSSRILHIFTCPKKQYEGPCWINSKWTFSHEEMSILRDNKLYIDINYITAASQLPECQTNSYCQSSLLKASQSCLQMKHKVIENNNKGF